MARKRWRFEPEDFPDYIPVRREDAQQVVVTFPKLNVSINGIAVPLYPAPTKWMVYVHEDWMPAIFWRKGGVGNDKYDSEWTRFKCDAKFMRFVQAATFSQDEWGIYQYGTSDWELAKCFTHLPYYWSDTLYDAYKDPKVRTLRAWTLRGWYVKDCALPVGIDSRLDHRPAYFKYEDCTPLPGASAAEKRMKLLMQYRWQADAEREGLFLKQYPSLCDISTQDDVEIAASKFVEEYEYLDFTGNRVEPTPRATKWLYAVFCAAAGYLV